MKNVLAFALVAASAATLCANDNGSNGLSAWATGHVSVKIVPSLQIKEEKALNFGRIIQGTSGSLNINERNNEAKVIYGDLQHSASTTRGEFSVRATDREDFQVTFENADVESGAEFGKGKVVTLTNGVDTIEFDATLFCDFKTGTPEGKKHDWKVYVGGALTVPADASEGVYTGTYKLIATYL